MVRRSVAITLALLIVALGGVPSLGTSLVAPVHESRLSLAQDGTPFNLTWTSRGMSTPQQVGNGSFLEGDHIALNATFLGHTGFVEPFNTSITIVGGNLNVSALSSTVSLDTYYLATNGSYSIEVSTTDSLDQNVSVIYEDVFLGNFFVPVVTVFEPDEVAEGVYNVTWTCTDQNADDIHFYDVWISSDGGVTYYRLARNLTMEWYAWNSTGFLQGEYIFRIRAFSIDLGLYAGPFIDLPGDYVPGDYGDGFYGPFPYTNGIPYVHNIGVSHPSDFTFESGATEQEIRWLLTFWGGYGIVGYDLNYTIYRDEAIWITDTLTIASEQNQYISVSVDSLSTGTYNITLRFTNPGPEGGLVEDSVIVHVTAATQDVEQLIFFILVGVSVGVVVLVALAVFLRRGR